MRGVFACETDVLCSCSYALRVCVCYACVACGVCGVLLFVVCLFVCLFVLFVFVFFVADGSLITTGRK